jgi:peptidoglycan/xylan/chitin deacetylase (PgdA/CDA1 family)
LKPQSWRRWLLVTAVAVGVGLIVVTWTEPSGAFWVLERLTPQLVYRVKTDEPLVALTFDDGPDPIHTPQVLAILEQHHASATFFVIGERALRHPELVARIKREGHEVGNHYFMDGSTLRHSEAEFQDYLERTERAAGIVAPKLFRPPGGVAWPGQIDLARSRGYVCVLGSAYPHDPAHPPVAYIRWLTEKNLAPGAIVILHDGIVDPTRGIAALPDILAVGEKRGLKFVSVSALMAAAESGGGGRG